MKGLSTSRLLLLLFGLSIPSFGYGQGKASSLLRCDAGDSSFKLPDLIKSEKNSLKKNSSVGAEEKKNKVTATIDGKRTEVNYSRYAGRKTPSKGTVVFLCGGPGFACTDTGRPAHIPEDYDVVQLDYLGIGANKISDRPEQMSIDSQGEAVASVVRSLGSENVLIYGQSFGTAVATAAASKLTQSDKPKNLKGVILEGTVGKAGGSAYGSGYIATAEATWSRMNQDEKERFTESYKEVTKNLDSKSREEIDGMIMNFLNEGPYNAKLMMTDFVEYLRRRPKKLKSTLEEDRKSDPTSRESKMQFRAAGCQIRGSGGAIQDTKIFDGLVNLSVGGTAEGDSVCKCRSLSKNFEPSEYQIKDLPVLYLNGEFDAPTPTAWAKTHFEGQKQTSDKLFIEVAGGGHFDFQGSGPISGCADIVYTAMFESDLSKLQKQQSRLAHGNCDTSRTRVAEPFSGFQ